MSSNLEANSTSEHRVPKSTVLEMEKPLEKRKENQEKHSSRENESEEHMMQPLVTTSPSTPLLDLERRQGHPPLAEAEIDDLDSPGVNKSNPFHNGIRPEENGHRLSGDTVDIAGPMGHDEEDGKLHDKDEVDYFGDINGPHYGIESRLGDRPISPLELEQRIIPDVNVYQQKKNLAQGMMDLALLSANANQLRYVIESSSQHPYFWPSLILISLSVIFQILVGIGLIMNSAYNVKNEDDICKADKINNFTIMGIFLVTIVNVFVAAFGVVSIDQAQNVTRIS